FSPTQCHTHIMNASNKVTYHLRFLSTLWPVSQNIFSWLGSSSTPRTCTPCPTRYFSNARIEIGTPTQFVCRMIKIEGNKMLDKPGIPEKYLLQPKPSVKDSKFRIDIRFTN